MTATNIIDFNDPERNMYGCADCPRCGSKFRASYKRDSGLVIECDECGLTEPARLKEQDPA